MMTKLAGVVLSVGLALTAISPGSAWAVETFDVIVPFGGTQQEPSAIAKDLSRINRDFGPRRFILTGPNEQEFGRGSLTDFERFGRRIAEVRKCAGESVSVGWWCAHSLRTNWDEMPQRIVDCDGDEGNGCCPLDPDFQVRLSSKVATVVRIGHPDMVFFDDDFTLSCYSGINDMRGCFCPRHLEAFAQAYGKPLSAKEIAQAFRNPSLQNERIRQTFARVSRDSLAALAKKIRAAVDAVDPSVRIGLCQSFMLDFDGDATETVVRAFAGGTRPLVRVYGAMYFAENLFQKIPRVLAHAVWSTQQLPSDIEVIYECDTYPHIGFYCSPEFLRAELYSAVAAGAPGALFYGAQYTDDALEEEGYFRMLRQENGRLARLRDYTQGAEFRGVRLVYTPAENYLLRSRSRDVGSGMLGDVAEFVGRVGMPATTRSSDVAVMFGQTARCLSDGEIRGLLSHGLFVDAEAAVVLAERGYGDLLGFDVRLDRSIVFEHEEICPTAGCQARGKRLLHSRTPSHLPAERRAGEPYFAALGLRPGAEAWSRLVDIDGKTVQPGLVCATNALGGRIAAMCYSVSDFWAMANVMHPRMKELYHNLFAWLNRGDLPVTAPWNPCVQVTATEKEDALVVTVVNVYGAPQRNVRLRFGSKWLGRSVSRLAANGEETSAGTATADYSLGTAGLGVGEVVVLRLAPNPNTATARDEAILKPLPLGAITAEGWLRDQLERSRDGMGGHLDELEPKMLRTPYLTREVPSKWDPYDAPGWAAEISGNYWTGLIGLAWTLGDQGLKEKADLWVQGALALQETDGYLGPFKKTDDRWSDFNAFGCSRGYLALLDYAEATHRPEVAEAVHRALLWFCRNWSGDRKTDYAGVNLTDAMIRCHQVIPDRRLVDFCLDYQRFLDKRDVFRASVKVQASADFYYNQTHATAYCNNMSIPARLYQVLGEPLYRQAAVTAAEKLVKYALHATGAQAGNDEYLSPPHTNGESEYCGFTGLVTAYGQLLAATGDMRWGDRMEETFFNAAQGARRKDEKAIQYFSGANAFAATPYSSHCCYQHNLFAPVHPTSCCAVLSVKILPEFVRSLAMTDAKENLVLTAYAPCRIRYRGCELECRTSYPFDGKIEYVVHAASPVRFGVRVKRPDWCRQMVVAVNGDEKAQTEREWKDGDVLSVTLAMPPRLERFEDFAGTKPLVVRRGPLCFSLPLKEKWESLGDGVKDLSNGHAISPLPAGWSWWAVWPDYYVPADAQRLHAHPREFKPWHVAIDETRADFVVESTGATGYVWEEPPVRIRLTGYRAPYAFAPYPSKTTPYYSASQPVSRKEPLALVPYGCTALRLTYFTSCDASHLIPDARPYYTKEN